MITRKYVKKTKHRILSIIMYLYGIRTIMRLYGLLALIFTI